MTTEENAENSREFNLKYGFTLRQDNEHTAIFKDGEIVNLIENVPNLYNKILDFKPRAKSVVMKKNKAIIDFIVESKEYETPDLSGFCINISNKNYDFSKKDGEYHIEIPFESIDIDGSIAGIYLFFEDENGFTFKKKMLSQTGPHNKRKDHKLFYSKVEKYDNHSIFIYETWAGYLTMAYREINLTDSSKEQRKIKLAFLKYKSDSKRGKNTPSILLFEKFCSKYEESAKYVYQRLIDDGHENVYFVLDENSSFYKEVPQKYRKNIIKKYSLKHYYEYFNAKAFISTESMNHAVELTTSNEMIRRRQMWDDYYFFFLQHGVMYAYSLKGRSDFEKGSGFRNNSFVVVSSEKEAEHFIEDGKFDREDLIKSGLPKFDYAVGNENADKILIMPTSRNFEQATIRDDCENSTYYNFSKRIIEIVPEELKEKIIFMPHPLTYEALSNTDLKKYMQDESDYDQLLKDTRLLITDYSSISYDAFYRGSNVIFAWMEKEMCLEELGLDLKLNDSNAFGDIAYDYEGLEEMILKNYNSGQSNENTEKYREIVEFYDGKNTERFLEFIYNTNLFLNDKKYNMEEAIISGIEDRVFTGKKLGVPKLKVTLNGKKLIRNIDFIVKNHNNKEIGTARCEIIGKGAYSGSKSIDYEIKKNIDKTEFEVNDEGQLIIIDEGQILTEEKDYTIEEKDYAEIGVKKIIIKGFGEYLGEKNILIDSFKE